MATPYTHTTLSAAAANLSGRLGDTQNRFYTLTETYSAIREALRMWNVITSQNREYGTFPTVAGTAFYQLATTLALPDTTLLRPQTITDAALIAEMKVHLLEDQIATVMYSTAEMVNALQLARNEFLADTACVLSARSDVVAASGTVDFPDNVVNIRRAVFQTGSGAFTSLQKSDMRTASAFRRDWQTSSVSRSYSMTATPALRVVLLPPPIESGTLQTYVVTSGADLDPTQAVATLIGVPDDAAWAVKWGALAILLRSDGYGSGTDQAERARKLYDLGVQLTRKLATVLHAELDGVPVIPGSIKATDLYNSGWQGKSTGQPRTLSMVGPDLVAVTPVPDTANHVVLMNVVRNTPVPLVAGDLLQLGRERLAAVLGMAQWLCMFKVGGAELEDADVYREQFMEEAQHYSFQRSAASSALSAMRATGQLQNMESIYESDPSSGVRNADEIRQERNAKRHATTA